jgi:hypothetical protein
MSDDEVFQARDTSDDDRARAGEAGWPDGLVDRMIALRWPEWRIALYLGFRGFPSPEMIENEVRDRERLTSGLAVHEATWEDDERLSDLYANSSERLGDWDVTVERSPNPYAQQRMQENAHVKLLVERGVALGVNAAAGRSSMVAGRKLSVGWMGAWRIRNGFRRLGYASLMMNTPGSSANVFGMITYWYVRVENATANAWITKAVSVVSDAGESARAMEKLTATVHHLRPSASAQRDQRVRLVTPEDVSRCVELVNATHDGLDLFRRYTDDFLEQRLDDLFWGPKPPFVPTVYGWADMFVLEDGGEIVACAGLWDRGRDVRDRWRHRDTGEERVVDCTYVMDVGRAHNHDDALAALLGHLLAATGELGRTTMVVALEFLPAVLSKLTWAEPEPETRTLETMGYTGPDQRIDAVITRPYTDLGYW